MNTKIKTMAHFEVKGIRKAYFHVKKKTLSLAFNRYVPINGRWTCHTRHMYLNWYWSFLLNLHHTPLMVHFEEILCTRGLKYYEDEFICFITKYLTFFFLICKTSFPPPLEDKDHKKFFFVHGFLSRRLVTNSIASTKPVISWTITKIATPIL